jgi:hypothetical protein
VTWSDIPLQPTRKMLRQFAAAWLVLFFAVGLRQYLGRGHHSLGLALMVLALGLGLLGLMKPSAIRWLFVGWMILAFPIGWTISQFMLLLMYYGLLTPVGLILRWRGRDLLHRKPAPSQSSFWTPKEMPKDVSRYFRQF